jgi:hypothetical protein
MGTHPYADAASDFAAPNPVAQPLREDHLESLLVAAERRSPSDRDYPYRSHRSHLRVGSL